MPVCANEHVICMYLLSRLLFSSPLFVTPSACIFHAVLSGSSQAIFKPCSLQCASSPLSHFLKCLRSNVNPELRVDRLLSLTLMNQNLLLTGMSATIKASPVGGVMLLKGFACLLEAGSGNTLGCHMCQPGMRQNSSERR